MYGATSGESGRMVAGLTRRYPDAFGLVEEAARAGERGQVVRTLLGRGSPDLGDAWDRDPDDPPPDPDRQARYRRAYGRFTRNFVVQGTGAEWALCWIADLRNRLWRLGETGSLVSGPHLVFFLHDEVVVHTPAALADAVAVQATEAAATAAPPAVPATTPSTSRSTSRSCGPTPTQANRARRSSRDRRRGHVPARPGARVAGRSATLPPGCRPRRSSAASRARSSG